MSSDIMELPQKDGMKDEEVDVAVPDTIHPDVNSEENQVEPNSVDSLMAQASDTVGVPDFDDDDDDDIDKILEMAHRVAASLDLASQGLRRSEVGAPCECENLTSTPSAQPAESFTQQSSPAPNGSNRHDEIVSRDRELFVVDISDTELVTLLFGQGVSAPPCPSSGESLSSSQNCSSQNCSEEASGNCESAAATQCHNEEKTGTQVPNSEASILTDGSHASDMQAGATASEGTTDAQVGTEDQWTPGPRIERPDYDEILGLRRLMRPSRRSRMRQHIEELFSVYVSTVLSGKQKLKVEDLPLLEITEEHSGMKCSVCLVDFVLKEEVYKLDCDHIYHKNCIIPWLEQSGNCPLCRRPVQDCASGGSDGQGNQSADIRLLFGGADVVLLAHDSSDDSSSSSSDSDSEISSDSDLSINLDLL